MSRLRVRVPYLLLIWACLLMFGFGVELAEAEAYVGSCGSQCMLRCAGHGGCAASSANGGSCRIGCGDGTYFELPMV